MRFPFEYGTGRCYRGAEVSAFHSWLSSSSTSLLSLYLFSNHDHAREDSYSPSSARIGRFSMSLSKP